MIFKQPITIPTSVPLPKKKEFIKTSLGPLGGSKGGRERDRDRERELALMEEAVIENLFNGEREVQVEAARDLSKLSSKQRQKLAERGVIEPLILMLQSQDYDAIEAALFALLSLAFGSERLVLYIYIHPQDTNFNIFKPFLSIKLLCIRLQSPSSFTIW